MRKNISRISKDVVTLDQKLSHQSREHSIYLINYLRSLLLRHMQESSNMVNEESKERDIMAAFNVGKNEKYLISKLKSYNITLEKIDNYLAKLRADPTLDQNRTFSSLA